MKKAFLTFSAMFLLSFVAMAAFSVESAPVAESSGDIDSTEVEEAVFCKVSANGNTATCWFCNCAELAAEIGMAPPSP